MAARIPIVNYLSLDSGSPHLIATVCDSCGARFFVKRLACARCGARTFRTEPAASTGRIGAFTVVYRAAAGVQAPFVSAVIDLDDGSYVKSNIVDCPPDPSHVQLGMKVELTTFDAATDDDGTVAVAFGFRPVEGGVA